MSGGDGEADVRIAKTAVEPIGASGNDRLRENHSTNAPLSVYPAPDAVVLTCASLDTRRPGASRRAQPLESSPLLAHGRITPRAVELVIAPRQSAQNRLDERRYEVESLASLDVLFSVNPASR